MKKLLLALVIITLFYTSSFSQTNIDAGPLNEVFRQTNLRAAATRLYDPWEITYGPDDSLWVTEAKAYKISKISPVNGGIRTVLDLSFGSTFLPAGQQGYDMQYDITVNNPQGGLMGMAIHPDFMNPTNPKRFIFVAYVYTYNSTAPGNAGVFYTNKLVRFTYNLATNKFDSPVSLCDSLPGSSDHNSGRLIIAPVGDSMYLFYAQGDMGAGQFGNAYRTNKAQNVLSYEGKILRFRINPDNDGGAYDKWIPSGAGTDGNPFNGASQSAVWAMGIRNNQGLAYANGKLYGSSHGPFTDDEINLLQAGKNYGHPLVIGDSTDGNYDNAMAGGSASSLPLIGSEKTNARNMGASYGNPFVSFYPWPGGPLSSPPAGTVQYIYQQFNGGNTSNANWPSEAPSGMDIYTHSLVPGWKNSIIVGCLKGGRLIRMNLNAAGTNTAPTGTYNDTNTLFRSVNRFRDVAISSDGRSIFTVIDSSATTSGPTTTNPIVSACRGCVQKYTFLGYNSAGAAFPAAGFTSTIPSSIPIAAGLANQCEDANTVVINAANNNTSIWVPITDTNSNLIAEIYANGHNLDTVRTSFFRNSGAIRKDGGNRVYADRNITITPQTQPGANIAIRLYLTSAEFNSLNSAPGSGIGGTINNVGIFKNSNNVCNSYLTGGPAVAVTTSAKGAFGGGGYVIQSNTLPSFSTFYFANASLTTLPVQLLSFTGTLVDNATLLKWTTSTELNTANFEIERSINGTSFSKIATVAAAGNSTTATDYSYNDNDVATLSAALIYYRLKTVDRDGNFDYSNTVTVSLAEVAGRVTIFPNPTTDKTTVTLGATADGTAKWKIVDNAGRTVMQNSIVLKKGRNTMPLNASKLSAGIYYLTVTGAGIDQKVKLQKL